MCLLLTLLFEFQENKSDLENFEPEKIMHCSNNEWVIRKVSFVCFFLWKKKRKMSTFWQWGKREVRLAFMAESRTATSELLDTRVLLWKRLL